MKKNDVILIISILLMVILVFVALQITKQEGSKVQVIVDGIEFAVFDLKEDTSHKIELEDGNFNLFEIKDGYVDMTKASCPDHICVKERKKRYNNETITCLPNKVILKIINADDNEVDAVSK